MTHRCALLLTLVLVAACGPATGKVHALPEQPVPWTLTVDPPSRYDEVAAIVSRNVLAFHVEQCPVTKPVHFVATPGWRFCGPVWTVGCNPAPDVIELDPDWAAYVVRHDLFHVFAEEVGNPYPGRDPGHQDPRWPAWDAWIAKGK